MNSGPLYRLRDDIVRRFCAEQKISQNKLAECVGVSSAYMSMLMNGQRTVGSETRRRFVAVLKRNPDSLFYEVKF